MEDILNKLIDLVQKTAPALWEIARRQVMALNVQDIAIAIILIIVAIIVYVLHMKLRDEDNYDQEDMEKEPKYLYTDEEPYIWGKIVGWVLIFISLIFAIGNIVSVIMRLVNPDYYAIQILMGLIK